MTRRPHESERRFQWPRWYWLIGWVCLVGPYSALILLSAAVAFARERMPIVDRWLDLAILLTPTLTGAGAVWLFWVCPWLASREDIRLVKQSPRERYEWLAAMLWAPIALAAIYGLLTFLALMSDWLEYRSLRWGSSQTLGAALLLACLPLSLWARWLGKRIRANCQRAAQRSQVCYACGYDLRGNPGAPCPECGYDPATSPGAQAPRQP